VNKTVIFSASLLAVAFSVASTAPGIAAQQTLAQKLAAQPQPVRIQDPSMTMMKGPPPASSMTKSQPVKGTQAPPPKQTVSTAPSNNGGSIISHDGGGIISHDGGGFKPR
jgi:hypothetical protein